MLKKYFIRYKQIIGYFFIGGTAACVEWITFYISYYKLELHYSLGVIIAFFIATLVNFILGRNFVFKQKKHSFLKELFLVYLVSSMGLPLNLLFMWIQIGLIGMIPMIAKIISTGLVFLWNYFSRKVWIY